MSKKQKPQLDRATRRKNRRIKVNARIARGRFFKNLSIWFVGLITSWVLVAAILLVFVGMPIKNFVPVRTEENPDGAISINLGDKSIINIFGDLSNGTGIQNYSLGDIPALLDALDGVIKDAGIDKFVCIDIDGLKNVKFVYDANDKNEDNSPKTISSELMKHIEVTASIESIGGLDMLGDFGKISIFSENTAVEEQEQSTIKGYASKIEEGAITLQQLNETLAEGEKFNPILYAYQVDASNYARAFNDNGEYVDGVSNSNQLYYRALKDVPVLELVDIIGESFSRVQTNDILQVAGIGSEGLIGDLIGGKTLEELGEMSTANTYLSTILEAPTDKKPNQNKMLYDILVPATRPILQPDETDFSNYGNRDKDWTAEDISIESLSSLEIDNVNLSAVIGEGADETLDLIANSINEKNKGVKDWVDITGEQVTVGHISQFETDYIKLTTVLPYYKGSTNPSEVVDNSMLYKVLLNATNIEFTESNIEQKAQELTIQSLSSFNVNLVKLTSVISRDLTNGKMFDILKELSGASADDEITLGDLSEINIDDLKLSTILPKTENQNLFKILDKIATGDIEDDGEIRIKNLFGISNFGEINLVDVFDAPTEDNDYANKMLYDILIQATRPENVDSYSYGDITISSLSGFSVENIKLETVLIDYSGDNFILNALLNVNGVTIGTLGDAMTNLLLFDVFGHGCFIKHSEVESFDKEVINPSLKFEYKKVDGTATYTLNDSVAEENAYYIKKDSGIWMLMCFDGTVEEDTGRTTTYTESTLTLGSLEEGSNIASRFTSATIRQLKDAGIFGETDIPSSLDKHTLKEALKP